MAAEKPLASVDVMNEIYGTESSNVRGEFRQNFFFPEKEKREKELKLARDKNRKTGAKKTRLKMQMRFLSLFLSLSLPPFFSLPGEFRSEIHLANHSCLSFFQLFSLSFSSYYNPDLISPTQKEEEEADRKTVAAAAATAAAAAAAALVSFLRRAVKWSARTQTARYSYENVFSLDGF